MQPTQIALDYDNTYTRDPEAWDHFIEYMTARGHEIRIVTVRTNPEDRTAPLIALEQKVPVIYTNGIAKKFFCTFWVKDFNPIIWIDDKPQNIVNNSTVTPEVLANWRETRDH